MHAGIVLTIIVFYLAIAVTCIYFGIKLINNLNPWGILLLFIPLNVIGILIGWIALHHNQNKKCKNKIKLEVEFENND